MKKEKTKEELFDYYRASDTFIPALEHYVEFQDYYRQLISEELRPNNPNIVSFNLMHNLINFLSGENVSLQAVLDQIISHAKMNGTSLSMVGIFRCQECRVKDEFPVVVKTNRDHIELIKNGKIDFEAHAEYDKIEEEVYLNMMIPENFVPACTCEERQTDSHEWFHAKTEFGVLMSEKDVIDLREYTLKKKVKEGKVLRLHNKKKEE